MDPTEQSGIIAKSGIAALNYWYVPQNSFFVETSIVSVCKVKLIGQQSKMLRIQKLVHNKYKAQ
jgi:hypothetical protein